MKVDENFIVSTDGESLMTMHSDGEYYEVIIIYSFDGEFQGISVNILNSKVKVK